MKITTFDPVIATPDPEKVTSFFEDLGFKKTHNPTGTGTHVTEGELHFTTVRMENPDGFHVDVSNSELTDRDKVLIRINVDDFEEACAIMEAHGGKISGSIVETSSAKAVTYSVPSGTRISIVHHIKSGD